MRLLPRLDFGLIKGQSSDTMRKVNRKQFYDLSSDGSLGRLRRSFVSWLGLLLLSFNIFGAATVSAQAAGTPLFAQELLDDQIVVCTAAGMVVLDRNGTPVGNGNGAAHRDICSYCLPLMHGGVQTPALLTVAILTPSLDQERFATPTPAAPTPVLLAGSASPRAPPRG